MKNLLEQALKIIPRSNFQYRLFDKRETNEFGQVVPLYGEWHYGYGIVEPGIISSFGGKNIQEKDYKDFGLDFSHETVTAWIRNVQIGTVSNRDSPDQIRYGGKIWNVIQAANWNEYNGWRRCYCQEAKNLGPESEESSNG